MTPILYPALLPVVLKQLPQGSRETLLRETMRFLELPELQSYVVDTIREAVTRCEIEFVEKQGFCVGPEAGSTPIPAFTRNGVLEACLKRLWRASPMGPHFDVTLAISDELPDSNFRKAIKRWLIT